ncbi:MAG: hypothetical protein J5509_04725 [Lachnospiraceae bacterium]|nr:hypothetical protein [Lachnospiraceae bacterium]
MKKQLIYPLILSVIIIQLVGCGLSEKDTATDNGGSAQADTGSTESDAAESGDESIPVSSDESQGFSSTFTSGSSEGADDDSGYEDEGWYDGPDFDSRADEFYGIFSDMTIEEAASKYAITLVDDGKYADYEGDIGDVIPEYKGKDFDGDGKPDVIKREGQHYVIEFSNGDTIKTGDFSSSPNEGEIIEFEDLACKNSAEILIAHYTFGTGGPFVWDTAIYSNATGEWKAYPLIDKHCYINSKDLRDYIEERTGKPYEPGCVRVAAADMNDLLIDFGTKDGAEQTLDYEHAYMHMYFHPDHIDEYDDYAFDAYPDIMSLVNLWPLELTGPEVELTSALQQKLNTYMSNFSEQNYMRYDAGSAKLAHFALEWAELNKPELVEYRDEGGYYECITQSDINQILGKYFGTNLEESEFYASDEDNVFNGVVEIDENNTAWYCEPAADGEMYKNNHFTVVTGVQNIGDDYGDACLRLEYTVYSRSTDDFDEYGITKEQYSLSASEASALADKGNLYADYTGTAIVQEVSDGYWLLNYKIY